MMKKIHLFALALLAMCAFGAAAASSAFAIDEMLLNEKEITAATPVAITGELLLEDMNATGAPAVLCSGIFDGTIAIGGKLMMIESLLMLEGKLLNEAGVENGAGNDMIDCTGEKTCTGEENLVTVLNLPWHVEIILDDEAEVFLAHFLNGTEEPGKEPTYEVTCKTILGNVTDVCEGLSSARLDNNVNGDAIGSFNSLPLLSAEDELLGAESESTKCSVGGVGAGLLENDADTEAGAGVITSTSGLLSVS